MERRTDFPKFPSVSHTHKDTHMHKHAQTCARTWTLTAAKDKLKDVVSVQIEMDVYVIESR